MKNLKQLAAALAVVALIAAAAFAQSTGAGALRVKYSTTGAYQLVNAAGTVVYSITPSTGAFAWGSTARSSYSVQIGTRAKVGGTAGWVVGAANDLPYIGTVAASQSAGTLVIPIDGLHIGDTITGFKINAQIESAGGAVTIDAALRAVTNVAAEPTDAAIGTGMTQVSVTADTASASSKTGLTEVVTSGKTYYLLVTVTTAGSTDVILQACEIVLTQS